MILKGERRQTHSKTTNEKRTSFEKGTRKTATHTVVGHQLPSEEHPGGKRPHQTASPHGRVDSEDKKTIPANSSRER